MNLKSCMVQNRSTAHSFNLKKEIASSNISKRHSQGSKYTVPATLIKTPSCPTDSCSQRLPASLGACLPNPSFTLHLNVSISLPLIALKGLASPPTRKTSPPYLQRRGRGEEMGSAITVFSLVAGRARSSTDMALLIILSYPSVINMDNHVIWGDCPHFHKIQTGSSRGV